MSSVMSVPSSGKIAAPTLAFTSRVSPLHSNGASNAVFRRSLRLVTANLSSTGDKRMANSSPPSRAIMSEERKSLVRREAICCNTRSPM